MASVGPGRARPGQSYQRLYRRYHPDIQLCVGAGLLEHVSPITSRPGMIEMNAALLKMEPIKQETPWICRLQKGFLSGAPRWSHV
jgi:hypothetical protein